MYITAFAISKRNHCYTHFKNTIDCIKLTQNDTQLLATLTIWAGLFNVKPIIYQNNKNNLHDSSFLVITTHFPFGWTELTNKTNTKVTLSDDSLVEMLILNLDKIFLEIYCNKKVTNLWTSLASAYRCCPKSVTLVRQDWYVTGWLSMKPKIWSD